VVWLTPSMDRLFVEGTRRGRRFLDRLVHGFDGEHAARLTAYEQAMRERARLLRDGPMDPSWLGALEETMAATGVAIAAARREGGGPARPGLRRGGGTVSGGAPRACRRDRDAAGEPAGARRRGALSRPARGASGLDRESGTTALGPHRSDFRVRHAATGMPAAEGSTGEQKALLIAIVLAHGRLQVALRGRTPIMLLDEVVAHLDPARDARSSASWAGLRPGLAHRHRRRALRGLARRAQFFAVADASLAPA